MIVIEQISDKESTAENGVSPACVGLTSSVLPEAQAIDPAESSDTGVSTNYIPTPPIRNPKSASRTSLVCTANHLRKRAEGIRLSGGKRHYRLLPYRP